MVPVLSKCKWSLSVIRVVGRLCRGGWRAPWMFFPVLYINELFLQPKPAHVLMNSIFLHSVLIVHQRIHWLHQAFQFKTLEKETSRKSKKMEIPMAVLYWWGCFLLTVIYLRWGSSLTPSLSLLQLELEAQHIFFLKEKFWYWSFNWNFISKIRKKSSFTKNNCAFPQMARKWVQKHTMKLKFLKVPLKPLLQLL